MIGGFLATARLAMTIFDAIVIARLVAKFLPKRLIIASTARHIIPTVTI
jgi:hypothetical protein